MHRCFWGVESYFFLESPAFFFFFMLENCFCMDVLEWWVGTYSLILFLN